jgi:hypothetical protein
MEDTDIYKMKLHEEIVCSVGKITRVPGGWIYTIYKISEGYVSVFVPFNNEFMDINKPGV